MESETRQSQDHPPLTAVMGATAAPNQYKANGPYLNYVYGAGRKNAVSNNLLVFDDRTLINDYAKYKSPPVSVTRPIRHRPTVEVR